MKIDWPASNSFPDVPHSPQWMCETFIAWNSTKTNIQMRWIGNVSLADYIEWRLQMMYECDINKLINLLSEHIPKRKKTRCLRQLSTKNLHAHISHQYWQAQLLQWGKRSLTRVYLNSLVKVHNVDDKEVSPLLKNRVSRLRSLFSLNFFRRR